MPSGGSVDLILDWNEVCDEEPQEKRSATQQSSKFHEYLHGRLLPAIQDVLLEGLHAEMPNDSPDVIEVIYEGAFKDEYSRPAIRLEIGPFAAWLPNATYEVQPYAAETFPRVFERPKVMVKAIKAERTFWEKVTILHQEHHRPATKQHPIRHSRHYYDVMCMAKSSVKESALSDPALLERVVAFKKKFYACNWAHYDLAAIGTLRLAPRPESLDVLARDFEQMQMMIFGEIPDFDDMMAVIKELEAEINAR